MPFFGKKGKDLDFNPEITIYHIEGKNNSSDIISFQVSSGDKDNSNKNIKIQDENISSMELVVKFEDDFKIIKNQKTINFESLIKLSYYNGDSKDINLSKHSIIIPQKPSSPKGTEPTFEEIKEELNSILQDEYAYALDDYNEFRSGEMQGSQPVKDDRKSKLDKIINICCIVVVVICLLIIGKKFLFPSANNGMTLNSEIQSFLEKEAKNNPEELKSNTDSDENIENEVLQEFGLEPGIKLD